MIIKDAIQKAIEGGYAKTVYPSEKSDAEWIIVYEDGSAKLLKTAEICLDPSFWQALGKSMGWTGEKIRMCVGCGVALRNNEEPTMDGKHGGQKGCGSDIYEYEGQWLIEMHRLIDHLAEGGTIESYFNSLEV